jgi:WD40 repeat protein
MENGLLLRSVPHELWEAVVLSLRTWVVVGAGFAVMLAANGPSSIAFSDTPYDHPEGKAVRVDAFGDPLPAAAQARLGTTRFRILGRSDFLGFAPDGKALMLLEYDGTLRYLDTRGGQTLRQVKVEELRRSNVWNEGVAVSGDGQTAVAGNAFSEVAVLNLPTGKAGRRIPSAEYFIQHNQGYGIYNFAFRVSNEGRLLAVVGQQIDGLTLVTWLDLTTGKRLHHQKTRNRGYFCPPAFSRDGRKIAAVEVDPALNQGWLRVWDVNTGNEVHSSVLPAGQPQNLAFLPDGKTLIVHSTTNGPLLQLDVATGKEVRRFADKDGGAQAFTLSPDGKNLYSANQSQVRQWDVATGKEVRVFTQHAQVGTSSHLAISADGKALASCGSNCVTLWDTAAGKELSPTNGHAGSLATLAFAPGGDRLVTAGSDANVFVWDLATSKELKRFGAVTPPPPAQWPPRQGRALQDVFGTQAFLSPDGKTLATLWPGAPIQVWEAASAKSLRQIGQGQNFQAMAMSADGRLLAGAGQDGQVWLWETATGKELRRVVLHRQGPPRPGEGIWMLQPSLAFSPDGRALAAGAFAQHRGQGKPMVRVWEVATGGERIHLEPAGGVLPPDNDYGLTLPNQAEALADRILLSLAFSPDGKNLVMGGGRGIYLWDLARGREARQFSGPRVFARAFALSPDSKLLAAGQLDGSVRLWQVESGRVLGDVPAHQLAVTCLAFSADGRRLASGSLDSTVLVWDVSQVIREASAQPVRLAPVAAEALWKDLASADPEKAFRAIGALVASPAEAVLLLKERLRPVPPVDAKRLEGLLKDLDDRRYVIRQKAMRDLAELAELAAPALKQLLAREPSAETQQRARQLLSKLEGAASSPAQLAAMRALEVLEQLASPEARQLLEALAAGAQGHRLTEEARTSLQRLAGRNPR